MQILVTDCRPSCMYAANYLNEEHKSCLLYLETSSSLDIADLPNP